MQKDEKGFEFVTSFLERLILKIYFLFLPIVKKLRLTMKM